MNNKHSAEPSEQHRSLTSLNVNCTDDISRKAAHILPLMVPPASRDCYKHLTPDLKVSDFSLTCKHQHLYF